MSNSTQSVAEIKATLKAAQDAEKAAKDAARKATVKTLTKIARVAVKEFEPTSFSTGSEGRRASGKVEIDGVTFMATVILVDDSTVDRSDAAKAARKAARAARTGAGVASSEG